MQNRATTPEFYNCWRPFGSNIRKRTRRDILTFRTGTLETRRLYENVLADRGGLDARPGARCVSGRRRACRRIESAGGRLAQKPADRTRPAIRARPRPQA